MAEPGVDYLKTRFDRTGMVTGIELDGRYEFAGYHPVNLVGGPVNEFGLHHPLGFEDTEPGQWFPKIGIGMVRKSESGSYERFIDREVRPPQMDIEQYADRIIFKSELADENGWGYRYEKQVRINDNKLTFQYHLENSGKRQLRTEEYNHNFFQQNQRPPGKGCVLETNFPLSLAQADTVTCDYSGKMSVSRWKDFLEFENPRSAETRNSLIFKAPATNTFMFRDVTEGNVVRPEWCLRDLFSGLSISEKAGFECCFINIWGNPDFICPELFFHINLSSGQKVEWLRTYQFDVL